MYTQNIFNSISFFSFYLVHNNQIDNQNSNFDDALEGFEGFFKSNRFEFSKANFMTRTFFCQCPVKQQPQQQNLCSTLIGLSATTTTTVTDLEVKHSAADDDNNDFIMASKQFNFLIYIN